MRNPAGEYEWTKPIVPPYGVVVAVSFRPNGEVESAFKRVKGRLVGGFDSDTVGSADERLNQTLRLIPAPGRKPLFLLNPKGKSNRELAEEAYGAIEKYREAKAKGQSFQPVIDIDKRLIGPKAPQA